MSRSPTNEQFQTAIFRLRDAGLTADERDACALVAAWIESELLDRRIKAEARKAGMPVKRLRDAVKRQITERLRQETGGVRALER